MQDSSMPVASLLEALISRRAEKGLGTDAIVIPAEAYKRLIVELNCVPDPSGCLRVVGCSGPAMVVRDDCVAVVD